MPSPKGPLSPEQYSTILRQAAAKTAPSVTEPSVTEPTAATADPVHVKNQGLKLPQLRADDRAESTAAPANENSTLMLMQTWQRNKQRLGEKSKSHLPAIIMFCGATLSAMWLAAAVAYVHNAVGWQNIKNLMPHEIGGFLAGLLAPIALFWMMLTFWLRSVDVKLYAETLRDEIQSMIFPSEEAEKRVNNDIERLLRQTAEMSKATRMALGTLNQTRQAIQAETKALQDGANTTAERLETLEKRLGERHANLASLQAQFEQKGQAFEKTSAQLKADAASFDKLVEATANKTHAIGQTLQTPIGQLQKWQSDVTTALDNSITTLTASFDTLTDTAAKKTQAIGETLQTPLKQLQNWQDGVVTALNGSMKNIAVSFDELADATAVKTQAIGQTLQEPLKQLRAWQDDVTIALDNSVNNIAVSFDKLADATAVKTQAIGQTLQEPLAKLQAWQHDVVTALNGSMTEMAVAFDQLADATAVKTKAIGQTLQEPLGQLTAWQNDVIDALNASMEKIQDKRTALRVDIKEIEDKATYLADILQTGTDKIYAFTDDALDKAKLIETRLQGQGVSLQETLQHIASQTEGLTAQRDELLKELAASGERGREELNDHIKLLSETAVQLRATHDDVAAKMRDVLREARMGWSAQADDFTASVHAGATHTIQQVSDAQSNIQAHYDTLKQTVERLTDGVQTLLQQSGQSWVEQADQFKQRIHNHATQNVALLTETQSSLKQGYDVLQTDLHDVAQNVHRLMQQVNTDLQAVSGALQQDMAQQQDQTKEFITGLVREHIQVTQTSTDQLLRTQDALNVMASELIRHSQDFSATGGKTIVALNDMQQSLDDSLDKVVTTTSRVQEGVFESAQTLQAPVLRLEDATQNVFDKAQVMGNILDQRITNLYELSTALNNQATSLGTDLATKSELLEGVVSRLQNDVRSVNDNIQIQSNLLDGQVRLTLDQVQTLLPQVKDLQQNFVAANEQADTMQTNLTRLTEAAQQSSDKLSGFSAQSAVQIEQSLDNYKQLHDTLQTLSAAVLAEHDRIREAYQADLQALQKGSSQVKTDAQHIAEDYQNVQMLLQSLHTEAKQSTTAASELQEQLQNSQKELQTTGQQLQQQTDAATQTIRVVQQILDGSVQTTLNHVQNLNSAMTIADKQSQNLQERAERLIETTQKHTDVIDQSVERLRDAATETDQTITAIAGFDGKIQQMQQMIKDRHAELGYEQASIEEAVAKAMQNLQQHAHMLAQTTQEAGKQAQAIRNQDQVLQREYFFNATKFIVESLHSLALDFTRMIDGEIPEKTWRAYQKGDTSIFAKRLVSLRDEISYDKLRQKFAQDVEFRTYVQRYIRQFEEIHNQAKQQDYGDLLSGVFTSSDIGRLYQMLKVVTGD